MKYLCPGIRNTHAIITAKMTRAGITQIRNYSENYNPELFSVLQNVAALVTKNSTTKLQVYGFASQSRIKLIYQH